MSDVRIENLIRGLENDDPDTFEKVSRVLADELTRTNCIEAIEALAEVAIAPDKGDYLRRCALDALASAGDSAQAVAGDLLDLVRDEDQDEAVRKAPLGLWRRSGPGRSHPPAWTPVLRHLERQHPRDLATLPS